MIKRLNEIQDNEVGLFGGKAVSLSRLIKIKGLNVPGGFVISSDINDYDELKDIILNNFDQLDCKFAAVRSSGNVEDGDHDSFAGQFNTILFVSRENLIATIKEVKASLNTSRIDSYLELKNISKEKVKLSIIIQEMVSSEKSGVVFTADPFTNNKNQIVIEACFGIGEAMVSGSITPDLYKISEKNTDIKVNKQTRALVYDTAKQNLVWTELNSKGKEQKLNKEEIFEIVQLAKTIKKEYGKEMDIEWTFADNKLYALQARPITTLDMSKSTEGVEINVDDYISLWEWKAPYIISIIDYDAFSENGKRDFIIYSNNNAVALYISKKERDKYSSDNYQIYVDGFEDYKIKAQHLANKIKTYFNSSHKLDLKSLTDLELVKVLKKYYGYLYDMHKTYSVAESFSTKKVEDKIIENKDKKLIAILNSNVKKMAELKMELREILNQLWNYKKGFLSHLLAEVTNRVELSNRAENYHLLELASLLKAEDLTLERRDVWIKGSFGDKTTLYGKQAKEIYNELSSYDSEAKKIEGTPCGPGVYEGKVRKFDLDLNLDYHEEVKKMKEGEIIVTLTTGPELVEACKKAGAIVTEIGGINSHAAIISRELGIPCIIGAANASKILKDGDKIRVDAKKGLITLLD